MPRSHILSSGGDGGVGSTADVQKYSRAKNKMGGGETNGSDTQKRVITIMVCVFLLAVVLSAAIYAFVSPDTSLLAFVVTFCVACSAIVIYRLVTVSKVTTNMEKKREELAKVKPRGCPDYWTSKYNCSDGKMECQGYFDGDDGRMFMSRSHASAREAVSPSAVTDSLCTSDAVNKAGGYPWMEVRNSCDVRMRK
jgi:hypothetical protein